MLLSVIIPVYKVEHTLDKCVESVLGQFAPDDTEHNMEVILVDDGSPDNCPQMCDEWARKGGRIKVIHKENGGLSDARNAGIEIAGGEYITFVDSDDYLEPDTYRPLVLWLTGQDGVDILEYELHTTKPDGKDLTLKDATYDSPKDYWENTRAWRHSYMCNKVFAHRLFDDIRFEKDKHFEDMLMLPLLLKTSSRIVTRHHGTYNYIWNEAGISADSSLSNTKALLDAQTKAQQVMGTTLFSKNGWDFLLTMLYRQVDIYRMSGEIMLHWPCIRIICWIHQHVYRSLFRRSK